MIVRSNLISPTHSLKLIKNYYNLCFPGDRSEWKVFDYSSRSTFLGRFSIERQSYPMVLHQIGIFLDVAEETIFRNNVSALFFEERKSEKEREERVRDKPWEIG